MTTTDEPITFTCPSCGETFPYDPDTGETELDFGSYPTEWSEWREVDVCYGCYEADTGDHASTLVRFSRHGTIRTVRFGDYFATTNEGDDADAIRLLEEAGITERRYVHTDGWRGYYDTDATKLTKVEDGWTTGYPDETTTRKANLGEWYGSIHSGDVVPPVTLWWLFEPTSNVFSTATTIYVADADALAILREWLAATDAPDLEASLR